MFKNFLATAALAAGLGGVSVSMAMGAPPTVPNPTVTPIPRDAGSHHFPFASTLMNLSSVGYVENEFQVSGAANIYKKSGSWKKDGMWNTAVKQADVPYATRILVRRPTDPAKFNGIVVVEWLNDTAFMDIDVIWAQSHDELIRSGYAWVGVTAQSVGVKQLKVWDRQRYGSLDEKNDGMSYDVFSQAGQAVRSQSSLILGGLPIKAVMAGGESQSAMRLTTYVDAFQTSASQVYDGVLIYSRFGIVAPLGDGIASSKAPYIRSDNVLKIIQFETEQDVAEFGFRDVRQDDTNLLRSWELAGASHYDEYGVAYLLPQYQTEMPKLSNVSLHCKNSFDLVPERYVVNAALSALSKWMTTGQAPPKAQPIDFRGGKVVRDDNGNAEGGIRLPEMDTAIATNNYKNSGAGGAISALACPFLGNTVPFDAATLTALYPTHQAYVSKFTTSANAALNAGFLLQADHDEAVAAAQAAQVP